MRRHLCSSAIVLLALVVGVVPAADKPAKPKHTNRLSKESSPYLLQHAHNPVDWYPWGDEAFARAKKEGKLIFLSIGYSSCHWCHGMEKESSANAEVAKWMNQWFVCIKVDREERPDIDQIYMTALTVRSRGRGGWPLSMFLTAAGKPIWGGTYWPPDDKEIDGEKIRGFKSILKLLHDFYADSPKEILADADKLADYLGGLKDFSGYKNIKTVSGPYTCAPTHQCLHAQFMGQVKGQALVQVQRYTS